jgi:hypothetical protein
VEEETKNQPIAIAFATTAVGSTDDNTTETITTARQESTMTITGALKVESKKVNIQYAPNRPENCSEYKILCGRVL